MPRCLHLLVLLLFYPPQGKALHPQRVHITNATRNAFILKNICNAFYEKKNLGHISSQNPEEEENEIMYLYIHCEGKISRKLIMFW